jgi:hypothetical protein
MAIIASQEFSTSNDYIKYTMSADLISQSVANNSSTIRFLVTARRTNTTGGSSYGSGSISGTINGGYYSDVIASSQKISYNSNTVLLDRTLTIAHGSDGKISIPWICNWSISGVVTANQGSLTVKPKDIPRATQPTVSPTTQALGSPVTISLPRAVSTYTHTIALYVDGAYYTRIAADVGTSYVWTPPESLASIAPNGTSKLVTISVATYDGTLAEGKRIGYGQANLTLTIPNTSAYQPAITDSAIAEAVTDPDIAAKFGAYVQGQSRLSLSMDAEGVYGSTIKSYQMQANGVSYVGAQNTTDPLTASGAQDVVFRATDTRGRTATKTESVSVIEYAAPEISSLSAQRCKQDGTIDADGAYAIIAATGQISPVDDKNDKLYQLQYRQKGESTWTTQDITPSSGYALSYTSAPIAFDVSYPYDVQIVATDFFGSSTRAMELPTAGSLFDLAENAVAIGMIAQQAGLTINGDWLVRAYKNGAHVSLLPLITPVGGYYETTQTDEADADMMAAKYGGTWELISPYNISVIDQGQVQTTADIPGGGSIDIPITFSSAFPGYPAVVASIQGSTNWPLSILVLNRSSATATLRVRNAAASAWTARGVVHWIATYPADVSFRRYRRTT